MDRRRRFHSLKKLLNKSLRNGESVTIFDERGNEVFRHNVAVNAVSDTELSVLKALSLTRLGRPCTVRIFGEQFRVEVTLGGLLIGRGYGPYRRTAAHVPFIRVEDVSGTDVTVPHQEHVSGKTARDPEPPVYGITSPYHECASDTASTPLDQTARNGLHTTVSSLQQISRADAIRQDSADSTEPLCYETPDDMSVNGGDYLSSSSNSSISSNNSSNSNPSSRSNTNNSSSSNSCNSMIGQCGRHLFIVCSRSKYTFFIDGYDFEERHLIETLGKIRTLLPE